MAHLATLGALLRQDSAPPERRRLLVNRARVGTLAGRLSFFDLHDSMSAARTTAWHWKRLVRLVTIYKLPLCSGTSRSSPSPSTGSRPHWIT
jgi:hypothetical protein